MNEREAFITACLRRIGDVVESSPSRWHSPFLCKISVLPATSKIEDKFPIGRFLVYAARNQSGADRSAPVINR
jgi:hypothetical protein